MTLFTELSHNFDQTQNKKGKDLMLMLEKFGTSFSDYLEVKPIEKIYYKSSKTFCQFRLGIQKCQEAIENSVGSPETIELDTRVSISKNRRQTLDFRQKRHFKEEEKRVASEKTAKVNNK